MNVSECASVGAPLFALAIVLFGCSPEPPQAHYTVDEYLANRVAMDAKLKECANNPGDLGSHPDCVNVKAAAARKGVGSLRDLPPLGLLPPEKTDRTNQTRADSGSSEPSH